MTTVRERLWKFLFPPDSGQWLAILRVGLGLQVVLSSWALRHEWSYLFGRHESEPFSRVLTEAILSADTTLTPRLGWLVAIGKHFGLDEPVVLSTVWLGLFAAGCCLLIGLLCRPAAVIAWFLYLCSVKSGELFAYGVDSFTTIGLFYLMIAPLPDRFSIDWKWRKLPETDPLRLGFHRRVLQLHLCLIYFFGGLSKVLGADWWNGNSVWRALTRPPFNIVPAEQLIRFEYLLPALGIGICVLETGYPIFIWLRRTRKIWLIAILCMHVSIGLTMGLYLFALIMIVLNLAVFAPSAIVPPPGMKIEPKRRHENFLSRA